MNIKKENVGIYVTWMLFGAGAGLTASSFLVSMLEMRRQNDKNKKFTADVKARAESLKEEYENTTREDLNVKQDEKAEIEASAQESNEKAGTEEAPNLSEGSSQIAVGGGTDKKADAERYATITSLYAITPSQEQLYTTGLITLDQLEEILKENQRDNHMEGYYDYGSPIIHHNEPSLEVLMGLEGGLEDSRFTLLMEPPEVRDPAMGFFEFGFIGEFEVLVRIHRTSRRLIPVDNVDEYVDHITYDVVQSEVGSGGLGDRVWVVDNEKRRYLSFGVFNNQEEALNS